jgi:putative transposase
VSTNRHGIEQVIGQVREVEVLLSEGGTVAQAAKQIDVTVDTYFRWGAAAGLPTP